MVLLQRVLVNRWARWCRTRWCHGPWLSSGSGRIRDLVTLFRRALERQYRLRWLFYFFFAQTRHTVEKWTGALDHRVAVNHHVNHHVICSSGLRTREQPPREASRTYVSPAPYPGNTLPYRGNTRGSRIPLPWFETGVWRRERENIITTTVNKPPLS